jgi:hypothetical protein
MNPMMTFFEFFVIIGGIVIIIAVITAFFVKGKRVTITTVSIDAENVCQPRAECAKLATDESEFSPVYRISEGKKYLWGLAKSTKDFEMDYTATVVTGLDLSKSGLEIDVKNERVSLNDPSSEVIATDINLENSEKYHGVFSQITTEDCDRYLKELTDHVRNVAIDNRILITAENKAIQSLADIYHVRNVAIDNGILITAENKAIQSLADIYTSSRRH